MHIYIYTCINSTSETPPVFRKYVYRKVLSDVMQLTEEQIGDVCNKAFLGSLLRACVFLCLKGAFKGSMRGSHTDL